MQFKKSSDNVIFMATLPLIKLSRAELERFRSFVETKEVKLADDLLLSILPADNVREPQLLRGSGHMRLSSALRILSKRVTHFSQEKVEPNDWKSGVIVADSALWEFTEFLEESVKEFIEQAKSLCLTEVTKEAYESIQAYHSFLHHRIEDLMWTFRKLDETFLTYRAICQKNRNWWLLFGKLFSRFSKALDQNILNHLFKAEESLSLFFKQFTLFFNAYHTILDKSKDKDRELKKQIGFQQLTDESQTLLNRLYRMLQVWDYNAKNEVIPQTEISDSIRRIGKPGSFTIAFREYYNRLKIELFELTLAWIKNRDRSALKQNLALQGELKIFENMVGNYREILLRSDPNPYVRTRFGFTEWIVGPEPRKTKDLQQIIFDIEKLQRWNRHQEDSIKNFPEKVPYLQKLGILKEIDAILHEMGQPLISRSSLQSKAAHLIKEIKRLDELGGSYGDVRDLLNEIFLKAFRFDSKYQVLLDFPELEELYAIHIGCLYPAKDTFHEKRLKTFHQILNHFDHWLKKHETGEHHLEIESQEAALKEELQQYYASLQRRQGGAFDTEIDLQKLLELRYLFSKFFHQLRQFEAEGRTMRKQLLFIDQYLDAIEALLREERVVPRVS